MSHTLSCPGCRGALVFAEPTAGRCGRCGGLWLTPEALAARGGRLGAELVAAASNSPRICPACAVAMSVYRSPSVEIDACDGCGGIFLDRGELQLLASARARANASGAFTCGECQREVPRGELVLGAGRTLCRLCGDRLGVTTELALHRQRSAELDAQLAAIHRADGQGSGLAQLGSTAVTGVDAVDVIGDILSLIFTLFG